MKFFLKSMHYCASYGLDKSGRTHGHTHIHRTKIVTTMSRLPASGLEKNGIFIDIFVILVISIHLVEKS